MTVFKSGRIFIGLLILAIALAGTLPTPPPTAAQDGGTGGLLLADYVLLLFSNYVGVSPSLTAAELDRGELNRPFTARYRFDGLDLREGLSCDSRVMDEDERLQNAPVGFRYLITLQGRTYEFRSNGTGSRVIRCYFGEEIAFNGNPRGIGPTLSGDEAVNVALRHAQGYLDLDTRLTVDLINNPDDDTPRAFYRWFPWVYLDASLACPARGFTYDVRDTFAFRVILNINGRYLDYRVRGDGNVALLCLGGRPHESSIGLSTDRTAISTDG